MPYDPFGRGWYHTGLLGKTCPFCGLYILNQASSLMKETSSGAIRTMGPYLACSPLTRRAKYPLRRARAKGIRDVFHRVGPGIWDRGCR
jgi:hypothetical protein